MLLNKDFFYISSILLLIILSVSISTPVSAHLDAGSDEVINGYLIDFGYAPAQPTALNTTILNFNLLNNSTQQTINFTSLFIRISDSTHNIFAGTFKPSNDDVNFVFTFPKSGSYTISVRFYNGSDVLVENDYAFDVSDATTSVGHAWQGTISMINYIVIIVLIVIIIMPIIFYTLFRKRKSGKRK